MRIAVTTLLMLIAGFLAGGLVAQGIALEANADQEFIIVFMGLGAVLILSTVVFFIVQFFADVRRAAAYAVRLLLALLLIIAAALIGIDLVSDPEHGMFAKSWPLIAGLTVPNAVIVIVQWLIVRWRYPASPKMPVFGRGARPA